MNQRLFEPSPVSEPEPVVRSRPPGRVVRVVVDIAAVTREFDYAVPPKWDELVGVGSIVRVPLHGRRVRAWVVAVDSEPPVGVDLESITGVTGLGPPAEIIDLCRWAAWRWAGRLPHFLGAASPDRVVRDLPPPMRRSVNRAEPTWVQVFDRPRSIVELGPAQAATSLVLAAAGRGPTLVICPDYGQVRRLQTELRQAGVASVGYPDGWAQAAAGATVVVGTRRAVLAALPGLATIVVVNEHDESLQSESSPTWHVRELAFERGRRQQVPVVLTSPMPTLEARRRCEMVVPDRTKQRAGWAPVVVIDRREDDRARLGLYSEGLVRALTRPHERTDGVDRAVCVLNRLGRAGLVACATCRSPTTCATCNAAVALTEDRILRCRQCGATRPPVCQHCGSTALRMLRVGVTRAREELEALLHEPVAEITGKGWSGPADARVVVGSEAALHQIERAAVVAFLEFDQELLAPRYRAAEQALALLVRAAALVGGRSGTVVVQTQLPEHPVLAAAVRGDSAALFEMEAAKRSVLGYPPLTSLIVVGGDAASRYLDALRQSPQWPETWAAELGPSGHWLLRGVDRTPMLDLLASTPRPSGRLRLWVDPLRLPG